jgi:hypothetical protein
MRTRVGVHYHLRVGPDELRLYDTPALAGPYFDIVYNDLDSMCHAMVLAVNGHHEEYLDEDDAEHVLDVMRDATEEIERGNEHYASMDLELGPFEFEVAVCTRCMPKGMN